mgnify:CR=1 FL=1
MLETSDAREVALPMQVLVNEKTSGEAELFAQAIRDYNKGGIVGTTTAGKGTMQTTFLVLRRTILAVLAVLVSLRIVRAAVLILRTIVPPGQPEL